MSLLLGLLAVQLNHSFACTTVVISGSATPDGRPLLFKNRDTGNPDNKVIFNKDGKYPYIGVTASDDSLCVHIWQGVNSEGFAIMNSLSYNINYGDTTKVTGKDNGTFIKLALETCATLDDFERLIETTPKPLGVEANFGVIDAHGGAAYYETGNDGYTKFDANDPSTAPFGYIIRTNFSFTGPIDKGEGYIRYQTAEDLMYRAVSMDDLTIDFMLQDFTRCLKHSLTKADLYAIQPESDREPVFVPFEDFIPRYSTASSTLIKGVQENEAPELSTMWTILGFSLCSVAIPAWVGDGGFVPSILMSDAATGNAPICNAANELKGRCFPVKRGSGEKYLDLSVVINKQGNGILQSLIPLEDAIIEMTEVRLDKWREKGFSSKDASGLCKQIDKDVVKWFEEYFSIDMTTEDETGK